MTGKAKHCTYIILPNNKNPYIVKKSGRKIELISKVQALYLPRPAA